MIWLVRDQDDIWSARLEDDNQSVDMEDHEDATRTSARRSS